MVFPDPFYWLFASNEAVRDKVPGICNPSISGSIHDRGRPVCGGQIQGFHTIAGPFTPSSSSSKSHDHHHRLHQILSGGTLSIYSTSDANLARCN